MCYFTGNLTKYVVRWRKKNGVADLEKAVHYLDKLIMLYQTDRRSWANRATAPVLLPEKFYLWCREQQLSAEEQAVVELACVYHSLADLYRLHARLLALLATARQNQPGAAGSMP